MLELSRLPHAVGTKIIADPPPERLDEAVDEGNIMTKLDIIISELKQLREKNDSQDKEIKRVEEIVKEQGKIIAAHQKFMEDLDAEKRSKDMIVLGLKEGGGENDDEKLLGLFVAIGVKAEEVKVESAERLGQLNEGEENENKIRPLKVTFEHKSMRSNVLRNSKNLKDQPEGSDLKRVFLKKDQHPEVRNEEKRLYEVFKAEKKKPQNADKEIVFNRKTRVVLVNNEEIDRFRLFSSFR